MEIVVVSTDSLFVSAVQGLAGAMGHHATASAEAGAAATGALLILDFGSVDPDSASFDGCDPLRTVAFVPASQPGRMATAQSLGIAGVFARGALPVELPRLLATFEA